MNDEAVAELAHRFLDAIANGDIDVVTGFYAENVVVWHNHDGIETTRDDAIDTLRRFVMLAPTRRYAGRRLDVFPGGFVEQHVLVSERDDGRRLELPACLIGRVAGGLITRLEEYFDPAPLMTWLRPAD